MVKCFYCEKEIVPPNNIAQISFDVPYVNLPLHKECDILIEKYGVDKYVQENQQRFMDFAMQNAVEFGSQSTITQGKSTKSKTLGKPTKKVKRK